MQNFNEAKKGDNLPIKQADNLPIKQFSTFKMVRFHLWQLHSHRVDILFSSIVHLNTS